MPSGSGDPDEPETAVRRFAHSAFDHLQPRPPARMPDITDLEQRPTLRAPRRGLAKLYNERIREGDGATREGER